MRAMSARSSSQPSAGSTASIRTPRSRNSSTSARRGPPDVAVGDEQRPALRVGERGRRARSRCRCPRGREAAAGEVVERRAGRRPSRTADGDHDAGARTGRGGRRARGSEVGHRAGHVEVDDGSARRLAARRRTRSTELRAAWPATPSARLAGSSRSAGVGQRAGPAERGLDAGGPAGAPPPDRERGRGRAAAAKLAAGGGVGIGSAPIQCSPAAPPASRPRERERRRGPAVRRCDARRRRTAGRRSASASPSPWSPSSTGCRRVRAATSASRSRSSSSS